jgi:hypothetical protein
MLLKKTEAAISVQRFADVEVRILNSGDAIPVSHGMVSA